MNIKVKTKHLDLFSGIGGFAYAADQVFGDVEHVFCDNNKFCQQVLKKHWPESEIYDDIRAITNTTFNDWWSRKLGKQETPVRSQRAHKPSGSNRVDILTGGFPCQPFSAAGKRRGTDDNRYLWPEMLRVIQLTKPTWVIAENVRGLLTWNESLVFEQVCADLEAQGYEVQPIVIPAVAVNAPHRRDRVWFIACNTKHDGRNATQDRQSNSKGADRNTQGTEQVRQPKGTDTLRFDPTSWEEDWLEVATRVCRVDDGLPNRVDRLKSLGNAIVPQVAIEIMKGITMKTNQ